MFAFSPTLLLIPHSLFSQEIQITSLVFIIGPQIDPAITSHYKKLAVNLKFPKKLQDDSLPMKFHRIPVDQDLKSPWQNLRLLKSQMM